MAILPTPTEPFTPDSVAWQNYFLSIDASLPANIPPIDARYLTATANPSLTNDVNLGALVTGFLFATVAAGIAVPSTTLNGASLTALNASQLTTGTVPDARFPAVLPAISGANLTGLPSPALPVGTVRQVVAATYATQTLSSSSTYADTGLSATITPGAVANKILVLALQAGCGKNTGDTGLNLRLRRAGTTTLAEHFYVGYTASAATNNVGSHVLTALDSPATVAAVTYTTQLASAANLAQAFVQFNADVSAIYLVEVVG